MQIYGAHRVYACLGAGTYIIKQVCTLIKRT